MLHEKTLPEWVREDKERRARAIKRRAKAYKFRLVDSSPWQVYIGPVRNRREATEAITALFGEAPKTVRVHSVSDPWPHPVPKTYTQNPARIACLR